MMKSQTIAFLAILLLIAMALGACTSPQPVAQNLTPIPTLIPATMPPTPQPTETPPGLDLPSREPSAANAQAVYEENCASCHGSDGQGKVPGARNFNDIDYIRGALPATFFVAVTNGRKNMPAWGDKFSVDDRWDLVFYVRQFALTQDVLAQGSEIFSTNCVACHGADGKGAIPGTPNFTDISWSVNRNPGDLYQIVTEGKGAMPSWQAKLSPDERWATVSYAQSFSYKP